jgi:hypothetical protein
LSSVTSDLIDESHLGAVSEIVELETGNGLVVDSHTEDGSAETESESLLVIDTTESISSSSDEDTNTYKYIPCKFYLLQHILI